MDKVKLISLECPSCGGTMQYQKGSSTAVCPYCGKAVIVSEEDEKAKKRAADAAFAAYKRKKRFDEKQNSKRSFKIVATTLFALFFVSCGIAPLFGNCGGSGTKSADPFANITIEFSGKNGNGRAQVVNENEGELAYVRFSLDKSALLKNGEKVTATAQSMSGYRWTNNKKSFTVSGLSETIVKLDQLSAEEMQVFFDASKLKIDRNWAEIKANNKPVTWQSEPYAVFLLLPDDKNQRHENLLYDTYKTTVTRDNGSTIVFYQAVRYDDVIRKGNGNITAGYDTSTLENWELGYSYGFNPSSAVYGWLTAEEMELEIKNISGYSLEDRK